jgi:hypothetical protein
MKLDVLSAMRLIAEPWRLITIKNCVEKFVFSNDHVSSNDDSALKHWKMKRMTGTECSLRTTQHVTVLSMFVVSGVSTRCYQHLTRPEGEPEEEEDDWHRVQLEDYTTCDSALDVCGVRSVDQVLPTLNCLLNSYEWTNHESRLPCD